MSSASAFTFSDVCATGTSSTHASPLGLGKQRLDPYSSLPQGLTVGLGVVAVPRTLWRYSSSSKLCA